jgi:hypothetical protein
MTTLLTVGFGLGNYGMITILLGQFGISVFVFILRLIPLIEKEGQIYALFPGESSKQFPSIWLANIVFFFGCLISSAYSVYKKHPADATTEESGETINAKVKNRKSRTLMIIVFGALLAILLVGYRIYMEGNTISTLSGSVLGGIIGIIGTLIWREVIKGPNIGAKNMDIFGISQQLITVTNTDVKTMCELKATT